MIARPSRPESPAGRPFVAVNAGLGRTRCGIRAFRLQGRRLHWVGKRTSPAVSPGTGREHLPRRDRRDQPGLCRYGAPVLQERSTSRWGGTRPRRRTRGYFATNRESCGADACGGLREDLTTPLKWWGRMAASTPAQGRIPILAEQFVQRFNRCRHVLPGNRRRGHRPAHGPDGRGKVGSFENVIERAFFLCRVGFIGIVTSRRVDVPRDCDGRRGMFVPPMTCSTFNHQCGME